VLAALAGLAIAAAHVGHIDDVWYGRGQAVVAWEYRATRRAPGWYDDHRYALTLWTRNGARTLIKGSPYAFVDHRAVRLADVTGDGSEDLLVTVMCGDCNHAVAVAAVFSDGRRIYGHGFFPVGKATHRTALGMHGRVITETAWGARRGDIWFDAPYGTLLGIHRVQTFLHWTGHGWRRVSERRVPGARDRLVETGFPLP
jgi:hypothetical protein